MKVSQLNLPGSLASVIEKEISHFNPVQLAAIKEGLLELKHSFVISSPTASGKTLIAELMMAKAVLEKGVKALYIVPLKALANEKYASFKSKYGGLGIKVAISTGDLDSADLWLANYDIIVLTSEKADSLLRHNAPFLHQVGVVVADECHLITDAGRGPTLEITITKLRKLNPNMLLLFLSATIANAEELAGWINAKVIRSDWRPVVLHEGVSFGGKVWFEDAENIVLQDGEGAEIELAAKTSREGKQAIIFAASRRNAEAIAARCCKPVKKTLESKELARLAELSSKIESALEHATPQCKKLAAYSKCGVAFHHAGLVAKQRSLIEQAFREGSIKIIAATPTLAAGMDLPAYRVLIRDAKRYYPSLGFVFLPVLEYEQMAGRAGRPRWDKEGQAILIARSEGEARELYNRFVLGESEEIISKLAVEPVLRTHILALIASEVAGTESSLLEFFSQTFWGFQYKSTGILEQKLRTILKNLEKWNFIVSGRGNLAATKLGERVSELYIDPMTAHRFLSAINNFAPNEFGLLHLISLASELSPPLRVGKRDYDLVVGEAIKRGPELLVNAPNEWDPEYEDFLDAIKTALAFEEWTLEAGEDGLYKKYRVTPGEIHSKLNTADWLLYSIEELCRISRKLSIVGLCRKMRLRLRYGIREELLELVRIKGVGRARARKLFNAGFRTLADLRKASVKKLSLLIGPKTAEQVKEELSGAAQI